MFSQLFLFIIGIVGIVMGLKEGDFFWVFSGLVMVLSGAALMYSVITGKDISEIFNSDKSKK